MWDKICVLFYSILFIIISFQLCDRSTSPEWNESFYFLVHDPKQQMLVIKARSCSVFTSYEHPASHCA